MFKCWYKFLALSVCLSVSVSLSLSDSLFLHYAGHKAYFFVRHAVFTSVLKDGRENSMSYTKVRHGPFYVYASVCVCMCVCVCVCVLGWVLEGYLIILLIDTSCFETLCKQRLFVYVKQTCLCVNGLFCRYSIFQPLTFGEKIKDSRI